VTQDQSWGGFNDGNQDRCDAKSDQASSWGCDQCPGWKIWLSRRSFIYGSILTRKWSGSALKESEISSSNLRFPFGQ